MEIVLFSCQVRNNNNNNNTFGMIKRKSINLSAIAITNFEKLNLMFIKRNPR